VGSLNEFLQIARPILEIDYFIMLVFSLFIFVGLFNEKMRLFWEKTLNKNPEKILLLTFTFSAINLFHVLMRDIPLQNWLAYTLFLLIPTVCLLLANKKSQKIQITDVIVILFLWLPFDLRIIQESWFKFNYLFLSVSAASVAIIGFSFVRNLKGLKINTEIKLKDILFSLKVLLVLIITIVPIGFILNFLEFGFKINLLNVNNILYLFVILVLYFLQTGLPEEILFRGLLQNLLFKTWNSNWKAVIVASVMFGSAHLDNIASGYGPPNWPYAILATIAGIGYGITYLKTKSIIIPGMLHACVDLLWGLFFVKV